MPFLPVVHDNLPVRRPLHAPRRPRATLDRTELPPAYCREHDPPISRHGVIAPAPVPAVAARRGGRQAMGAVSAEAVGAATRPGARTVAEAFLDRSAASVCRRGRTAAADRAVAGLRPENAGTRDQRGDNPTADPLRLRGCRRVGQRLL